MKKIYVMILVLSTIILVGCTNKDADFSKIQELEAEIEVLKEENISANKDKNIEINNTLYEVADYDSPYSGMVEVKGRITSIESLDYGYFFSRDPLLEYCNNNKKLWGTEDCPTVINLFIELDKGYFDKRIFPNESSYGNKLILGCLRNGDLVSSSIDSKYRLEGNSRYFMSESTKELIIQSINRNTEFTFRIHKNAYNRPERSWEVCDVFIDKLEVIN